MEISPQKQVLSMKHFKFILFFLIFSPLMQAQECISGNCENGFGTKKTKTFTYKGNFKEGRMHGNGTYEWKDGGSYIGDFRDGFFEGIGLRTYESGTIYKGHFKYDKPHGAGTMTYTNGSIYKGLWQFGYKHGEGIYKDNKGYSHEGTYKFGKSDGVGEQKWEKGDIYEGSFKKGYRDGFGSYTWPSGETFEGSWKLGKKHGVGISRNKSLRILKKGIWFEGEHTSTKAGCLEENQECLPDRICCSIANENSEVYYTRNSVYRVVPIKETSFLNVYSEAKKRYYYDESWNLTTNIKSKYYREYTKLDSLNMTYKVKAYYTSNNQLQWDGNIINNNPTASNCNTAKCEGKTTWYREDGSLSSESYYLEGRLNGKSILYLKNGKTSVMNTDRGIYIKKD